MNKELIIGSSIVVTVLLFLYVYHNGGFAKFCATPLGPCVDGKK